MLFKLILLVDKVVDECPLKMTTCGDLTCGWSWKRLTGKLLLSPSNESELVDLLIYMLIKQQLETHQ